MMTQQIRMHHFVICQCPLNTCAVKKDECVKMLDNRCIECKMVVEGTFETTMTLHFEQVDKFGDVNYELAQDRWKGVGAQLHERRGSDAAG